MQSGEQVMSAEQSQDEAASASAVGPTKPRSDWYQTQSNVCIDVMVKGVKREDASVAFTDKTVRDERGLLDAVAHSSSFLTARRCRYVYSAWTGQATLSTWS